jgi:hypothetical protein
MDTIQVEQQPEVEAETKEEILLLEAPLPKQDKKKKKKKSKEESSEEDDDDLELSDDRKRFLESVDMREAFRLRRRFAAKHRLTSREQGILVARMALLTTPSQSPPHTTAAVVSRMYFTPLLLPPGCTSVTEHPLHVGMHPSFPRLLSWRLLWWREDLLVRAIKAPFHPCCDSINYSPPYDGFDNFFAARKCLSCGTENVVPFWCFSKVLCPEQLFTNGALADIHKELEVSEVVLHALQHRTLLDSVLNRLPTELHGSARYLYNIGLNTDIVAVIAQIEQTCHSMSSK